MDFVGFVVHSIVARSFRFSGLGIGTHWFLFNYEIQKSVCMWKSRKRYPGRCFSVFERLSPSRSARSPLPCWSEDRTDRSVEDERRVWRRCRGIRHGRRLPRRDLRYIFESFAPLCSLPSLLMPNSSQEAHRSPGLLRSRLSTLLLLRASLIRSLNSPISACSLSTLPPSVCSKVRIIRITRFTFFSNRRLG